MVAWVRVASERLWRPRVTETRVLEFPLLQVLVPPGDPVRRMGQAARILKRYRAGRVLLPPGWEGEASHLGLRTVDPLPLCRAKGADLTLALLERVPLRDRRVAIRGDRADGPARVLAHALCPQVGTLYLDFDRGGEELAGDLMARYGAPPFPLGQGLPPQVSVELAPRGAPAGAALRLWGTPDLRGVELTAGAPLPKDLPPLPFLTLLWESGRVKIRDIIARKP